MRTLLAAALGMAALAFSPASAFAHHNLSHSIVVTPEAAPCAHHRASPSALSAALQFASGQRPPVALARDRQVAEADCMPYEGMGVITAVSATSVTVRHAPIRSRRMPAMTMAFAVTEVQSLQGLAVGDKVCFSLKEAEGGAPTIDRIMKR